LVLKGHLLLVHKEPKVDPVLLVFLEVQDQMARVGLKVRKDHKDLQQPKPPK
jgi:hypothetical protein